MISVDRVYQKVLAIANKEQRGYITPQEFNLFADYAQMDIFEQYFYDVEQFERRVDNTAELTKTKIEVFKKGAMISGNQYNNPLPADNYLIESVWGRKENGEQVTVEKLDRDGQHNVHAAMTASPLLKPNETRPVYWVLNNTISFDPILSNYGVNYIKVPEKPNWTYIVSGGGHALFNPDLNAGWRDFELHPSEENTLVIKILQLTGVNIKDYNLTQVAAASEAKKIQQEKS